MTLGDTCIYVHDKLQFPPCELYHQKDMRKIQVTIVLCPISIYSAYTTAHFYSYINGYVQNISYFLRDYALQASPVLRLITSRCAIFDKVFFIHKSRVYL